MEICKVCGAVFSEHNSIGQYKEIICPECQKKTAKDDLPMKCFFYRPYMDTLKKIIKGYYTLPGCGAGGPLHILLDDDNYDLGSIHFCMEHCFENLNGDVQYEPYSKEVCVLGIMICNEYAKMSLGERAAFDAYLCRETLECKGDCENCSVLGELFEYMKEAEKNAKT